MFNTKIVSACFVRASKFCYMVSVILKSNVILFIGQLFNTEEENHSLDIILRSQCFHHSCLPESIDSVFESSVTPWRTGHEVLVG